MPLVNALLLGIVRVLVVSTYETRSEVDSQVNLGLAQDLCVDSVFKDG